MVLDKYKEKKYYFQFAAYFLIFGIVVGFTASVINYNRDYKNIDKELSSQAEQSESLRRQDMTHFVRDMELVVSSISTNDLTHSYLKNRTDETRTDVINLFYSLVYANPNIMQLRYIDRDGMEQIRLDRDKNSPQIRVVPQEKLQNKRNRYYFKEASQVSGGSFWHSNIDLNIENGKIETPLKPTFRVAAPILSEGAFEGIIIVNVMAEYILEHVADSAAFDVYLIDSQGEIITAPKPEQSWSRYLENRPGIEAYIPDFGSSAVTDKRIYVYSYADIFNNSEDLKIIFVPKQDVINSLIKGNTATAFFVALVVLLISIPLSWVASIVPSKLQHNLRNAYDEVSRFAKIIDRNIPTSKTDANGTITDVSTKFLMITGYNRDEIVGKKHNLLRHPDTQDEYYRKMWETISKGAVWSGETKDKRKDGKDFWIKQTITPQLNAKGDIVAYTSIAQDITERKMIEQMSITDRLTKLYNRHKLDAALQDEVNRFNRYRVNFSAILLDIDHFKKVNDTYGHQAGDDVLVKLAETMKKITRETDICGRWGGEEFIVIAVETDLESAAVLAEKLRSEIEKTEFPPVDRITVSMGLSQYEYGETIAHFINRADDALYKAKKGGRNRAVKAD